MKRSDQFQIISERLDSNIGLPRPVVSKSDHKNSLFVVQDVDLTSVRGEGSDIVEAVDDYTDKLIDRVRWLGLGSPFVD